MGSTGDVEGHALFSTCTQSIESTPAAYLDRVIEVAKWSEDAGCTGILVYTDNGLVDPWTVAQTILLNTERLSPLIAIQPIYMHPYTVANLIASFAFLHGRRVYLNMLAGGFRNDLIALNDQTPHDQRYDRLIEYTTIIVELLKRSSENQPLTFEGEFYRVENLKLTPVMPPELMPGILLSGSSEAGMKAIAALEATGVQYPKRVTEYVEPLPEGGSFGIRVGVVARDDSDEAWRIARERFPEDRKGQIKHQLAMKVSDSSWHQQLSDLSNEEDSPYWLWPFENYKTFCPYLVGSYDRVAEEFSRYMQLGYATFIVDIPRDAEDLAHTKEVLTRASELIAKPQGG